MIGATTASAPHHTRHNIHYWKCDRPGALEGVAPAPPTPEEEQRLARQLHAYLARELGAPLDLAPAGKLGNHRTFLARRPEGTLFVRVENGPEGDRHMETESRVILKLRARGTPVPEVVLVDASRQVVPFSIQVLEYFASPDLASHLRRGEALSEGIATDIGRHVADWQELRVHGYGPLKPGAAKGYHARYRDYFLLNLERHLAILTSGEFLTTAEADSIKSLIQEHAPLLELAEGCLVHKDLALWNILGTPERIDAFIDWDDAIGGDALDDLSLLACFEDAPFVARAFAGYASRRPLPVEYRRRYWLHLLRNMIVKAVIRVSTGCFARPDHFLWSGRAAPGFDPQAFTRARMAAAERGLRGDLEVDHL